MKNLWQVFLNMIFIGRRTVVVWDIIEEVLGTGAGVWEIGRAHV